MNAQGDVATALVALERMGVAGTLHQLYPRVHYWLNPRNFDDTAKRAEMVAEGAAVATQVLG